LAGPERKARIPDEEANTITAYHEGGHAVVAYYTKDSHPLHKVTIIPRGPSLGHVSNSLIKNDISILHAVGLFWVLGHAGVRGNEIADGLTRGSPALGFVGPEPAVSRQDIRRRIRRWLVDQHGVR
jgi:hypothetical protein